MKSGLIKILVLEDNDNHYDMFRGMLYEYSQDYICYRAKVFEEIKSLVANYSFDVAVIDLSLPDSEAFCTVDRFRLVAGGLPLVVLTSITDDGYIEDSFSRGAEDYITKGELSGPVLSRSIRYSIERKKYKNTLEDMVAHLREANQDMEQFLSLVKNEIFDSLEAVRSLCGLISTYEIDSVDSIIGKSVQRTRDSLAHLNQITNELLIYAKLGVVSKDPISCDVNNLFLKYLGEVQNERESKVEVNLVSVDSIPKVSANVRFLKRIFKTILNLVLDAETNANKIALVYDKNQQPDDALGLVRFKVQGLETKFFDRLGSQAFTTFRKLFSYSTAISLCIAQQLILKMKGSISVESNPNSGISFIIELPAAEKKEEHIPENIFTHENSDKLESRERNFGTNEEKNGVAITTTPQSKNLENL